jgi:hypothetical protein
MKKRILVLLTVALVMVAMMAASAMPTFAVIPQNAVDHACEHPGGHGVPQGGPHAGVNPIPFCVV